MVKNLVAIDLGAKQTKVLSALLEKGILEVESADIFVTPYQAQEIDARLFFEQVNKLIPAQKLKDSLLAVSLPASAANFSVFTLPKMPKEELDKVVLREARQKILPAPAADDIFEYAILKEEKIKNGAQLKILAGAAAQQVITQYLSLFAKQEVIPDILFPASLALMRYFQEYKSLPADSRALVDIGFKNTSIVVMEQGEAALIRNIPFATADFMAAIVKKCAYDFAKAEELFLREQVGEDMGIGESWQYLLTEARRSLAYYKEVSGGRRIDSIMLSGGVFALKKPLEFLKKNIGGNLEVFQAGALKDISFSASVSKGLLSNGAVFATAFGLLLSLRPAKYPVLNFLPLSLRRERQIRVIKLFSLRALILIAALLALLIFGAIVNIALVRGKIKELKQGFSETEYRSLSQKAAQINAKLNSLKEANTLISNLSKNQFAWEKLFSVLSQTVPDEVFLREVSVGEEEEAAGAESVMPEMEEGASLKKAKPKKAGMVVRIKGAIISDYESAKEQAEYFYRRLKESGYFSEINLEPPKLEGIAFRGKGEASLTQSKEREFTLQGKVALK